MTERNGQECEQRDVAVGWALHALEPEEEAGFARHLPHCADCTDRVRGTEAVAAVLGAGVTQLDPPPRLRAAILAAARAQPPAPSPVAPTPPLDDLQAPRRREIVEGARPASRTRRVLVAAVAVGLLAFGAGWAGNALVGSSSATRPSALSALSNGSVRSTPLRAAQSGRMMAVVLSDGSSASVVPLSMPSAPSGKAYWLWGTSGPGAAPVALGKVVVGGGAAADLQLQGSAQRASFSGYALSVEPDAGVPAAPSTVIGTSGTI